MRPCMHYIRRMYFLDFHYTFFPHSSQFKPDDILAMSIFIHWIYYYLKWYLNHHELTEKNYSTYVSRIYILLTLGCIWYIFMTETIYGLSLSSLREKPTKMKVFSAKTYDRTHTQFIINIIWYVNHNKLIASQCFIVFCNTFL